MRISREAKRELLELYHEHGRLTPELVVERARPHNSALHPYFTWDDAEAAMRWRLEQARRIIRTVRLEVKTTKRAVVVPRFVATRREYRSVETVSGTEDAAVVVEDELRRALGVLRRARDVLDALGRRHELDEAIEAVERTLAGMGG